MKQTSIQSEEVQNDYGHFGRIARAFHKDTGEIVNCRADIPDTFFSIPATTKDQHGCITGRDDGELEFRPHTNQTQTPASFRNQYKKNRR